MDTNFEQTQTNEVQKTACDKLFDSLQNDGICAVLRLGHKQTLPEKGKDAYFCYPFWDVPEERVSYLLLVRRSAVPQKGLVRFKVDEDIIARLIGNGGKNIKEIAKELGVNYIKVEKIKRKTRKENERKSSSKPCTDGVAKKTVRKTV